MASVSQGTSSTHPDFPNGTEVINCSPRSGYFGQRGIVYGSGPSKNNDSGNAVIFVTWPDGQKHSYFPSRLSIAPKNEKAYKISSRTREGKRVTIHEVPAEKRSRPNIFARLTQSLKDRVD